MADNTLTMQARSEATDPAGVTKESARAEVDRPMVLAHRRSPAHDLSDAMVQGSGEAVRLRELPFLSQLAIRVPLGSGSAEALAGTLGVSLPARVGEVTGSSDGSGVALLWLSPDEFLAVGQDEALTGTPPESWAAQLDDVLADQPGQVVDVSANRTTLELSGPWARSVLEKSCEIDLHPRAFPVGTAVITLLESTGVIVWRTGEEAWRVMPRASFATHVVRWLLDGMREYR